MNAPVRTLALAYPLDTGLDIIPSGAALGADVYGADLTRPLDSETVAALRAALNEHKVLFFRDQDISHEDHLRFGRYFGELEGHPVTGNVPGFPEILKIENGEYAYLNDLTIPFIRATNKWHTDVTFRDAPSALGILRARKIPPRGGDTLFADSVAAFEDLPAELKTRLEGLTATHDILKSYGWKLTQEEAAELSAKHPPISHPVVRVHPETGEKALYVNHGFTTKIDGLPEKESADLLAPLFDRVRIPEYQVRFKWSENAIVVWDNRSTQHYPIADYYPHGRIVERVTVVGDKPFGVTR